MKMFLSVLCALMLLYVGQDDHTTLSIDAAAPPLSTPRSDRTFEIKYQHIRFVGQEIEVLAHDLWETQTLRLRIPADVQTGDSITLDTQSFHYQKDGMVYRTLEGFLRIQKSEQTTEPYCIEALLYYCVTDEKTIFCVSKMPIRVVY